MGKDSDSPELKVGPLATDATPKNLSGSTEEAQKRPPKLDPTPNGLHDVEKNDRPIEEFTAAEGGVVTHENSEADGGDVNGK